MFKFSLYIMFPIGSLWLFHELDFNQGFSQTRQKYEDLVKPKEETFTIPKDWNQIERVQDDMLKKKSL